jgi:hypothetical protein
MPVRPADIWGRSAAMLWARSDLPVTVDRRSSKRNEGPDHPCSKIAEVRARPSCIGSGVEGSGTFASRLYYGWDGARTVR